MCLFTSRHITARQRLGKNAPAAMNAHVTIKELLDAVFCAVRVAANTQYARKPNNVQAQLKIHVAIQT
jgi:hypothetical protein